MNQMGFFFDQTRCTGCYTCSVACKDWHDIDDGVVNWMRLKAIERGTFPDLFVAYLASPCYHCENPACILVCPADAIVKRDSDGIVVVDQNKCLGKRECGARCLKACPWDSPQFDREDNAKMQKCDLCLERLKNGQQPVCIEACPMFALDAGDLSILQEKYDDITAAEGFRYSGKIKPSVLFKPKREG